MCKGRKAPTPKQLLATYLSRVRHQSLDIISATNHDLVIWHIQPVRRHILSSFGLRSCSSSDHAPQLMLGRNLPSSPSTAR